MMRAVAKYRTSSRRLPRRYHTSDRGMAAFFCMRPRRPGRVRMAMPTRTETGRMTMVGAGDPSRATGGEIPTDAELLARWSAGTDPDAIEQFVRRHGRMVLGVCRRVLGDTPDVDDAFQ